MFIRFLTLFFLLFTVQASALEVNGELKNAVGEKLASDPVTGLVEGRIYYNTTTKTLRVYDGSAWRNKVDTNSTQTLTNKTINGNNNTLNVLAPTQLEGFVPIANGGTGQSTKAAAYDALSPNGSQGDLTYRGVSSNVALPVGANGQVLTVASGYPSWADSTGGAGSGEKNYITNPSAATAITGWVCVGDLDVVRTVTAGDLPRENTTPSGIKITADTNTQSVADYCYFDFTLDDIDLNRKLNVKFGTKQTGSYVSNDLAVVITTQADRTTAIATPVVTNIAAADYDFNGNGFDTASTTTLSLVIRATADMATNAGVTISDVVVGPGTIIAAAPIGPWIAYTPAISSSGGALTLNATGKQDPSGFYRRVGDSVEVQINFKNGSGGAATGTAGNVRLSFPTGITPDTSAMTSNSNYGPLAGSFGPFDGTNFDDLNSVVVSSGFLSIIRSGTSNFLALSDIVANYGGTIRAIVPVSEWAGAPNYAGSNDVEYAYNTGTWDATDTTSFGYGPNGQILGGALSGSNEKRVRFLTAIQPTDIIELQLSSDRVSWYPAAGGSINDVIIAPMINSAGSASSGVWVRNVSGSTTDMDIFWGRYIQMENDDGASINWPSSGYWRVMKARGGSAVGFGAADSTRLGLVKQNLNTSFTVALTGPITSSATFRASRVGDVVTISWPQAFATGVSSAANITLNFTNMPLWARPFVNSFNPTFVRDNGTDQTVMGTVFFPTSGNGSVSRTYLNQFTSSTNSTGFEGGSASYVGAAW
jgi:hypothetical protein